MVTFDFVVHMVSVAQVLVISQKHRPGAVWRSWAGSGVGKEGLTQAGCGCGIWRVPGLAVALEGAKAVDALTIGTQAREHTALVHIWGQVGLGWGWLPRVTGA